MIIISFQKTVEAVRDGTKTVTRRFWKPSHAKKFYVGMIVAAWTAGPHRGGKLIRKIRITEVPYRENLLCMSLEHFEREGGSRYWDTIYHYIDTMMESAPKSYDDPAFPYVIEFDYEVPG